VSGYNSCTVYGNVGSEPDVRFTANGVKYAKFSIAVNKVWRDKAGEKRQETTWFNCEVWNEKQADLVEQYVHKGDLMLVEGEIRTYEYEKDGRTAYGWSLKVLRFPLPASRRSEQQHEQQHEPEREPESPRKAEVPPLQKPFEDDIPF